MFIEAILWLCAITVIHEALGSGVPARMRRFVLYKHQQASNWHQSVELCSSMNGLIATFDGLWERDVAFEMSGGREPWIGLTKGSLGNEYQWISAFTQPVTAFSASLDGTCGTCGFLTIQGEIEMDNCFSKRSFVLCEFQDRPEATDQRLSVVDLSSSNGVTCTITNLHRVRCLGRNDYGQLGTNLAVDKVTADDHAMLMDVIGVELVQQISVGSFHVCARTAPQLAGDVSNVWCWGRSDSGQAGVNKTIQAIPELVEGLPGNVIEIACGGFHTCVRTTDDKVYCFGDNSYMQVTGTRTNVTSIFHPVLVEIPEYAKQKRFLGFVTTGYLHTCVVAVRRETFVAQRYPICWGNNERKQCAMSNDQAVQPTPIFSGRSERNTTAGGNLTCFVEIANFNLYCSGIEDQTQFPPVQVTGMGADIADLAVGSESACSLRRPGASRNRQGDFIGVYCVGGNRFGQLGLGNQVDVHRVTGSNVVALGQMVVQLGAAGGETHCAILRSRNARCWGRNSYGELAYAGMNLTGRTDVNVPDFRYDRSAPAIDAYAFFGCMDRCPFADSIWIDQGKCLCSIPKAVVNIGQGRTQVSFILNVSLPDTPDKVKVGLSESWLVDGKIFRSSSPSGLPLILNVTVDGTSSLLARDPLGSNRLARVVLTHINPDEFKPLRISTLIKVEFNRTDPAVECPHGAYFSTTTSTCEPKIIHECLLNATCNEATSDHICRPPRFIQDPIKLEDVAFGISDTRRLTLDNGNLNEICSYRIINASFTDFDLSPRPPSQLPKWLSINLVTCGEPALTVKLDDLSITSGKKLLVVHWTMDGTDPGVIRKSNVSVTVKPTLSLIQPSSEVDLGFVGAGRVSLSISRSVLPSVTIINPSSLTDLHYYVNLSSTSSTSYLKLVDPSTDVKVLRKGSGLLNNVYFDLDLSRFSDTPTPTDEAQLNRSASRYTEQILFEFRAFDDVAKQFSKPLYKKVDVAFIPVILCPAGYYSATRTNSEGCRPCAEGYHGKNDVGATRCETKCGNLMPYSPRGSANETFCSADRGFYKVDSISVKECPKGTECDTPGSTLFNLKLIEGFWRPANNTTDLYPCTEPDYCLGGNDSSSYCAENHAADSRMCFECLNDRFVKVGADSVCTECTEEKLYSDQVKIAVGIYIMVMLLTVAMYAIFTNASKDAALAKYLHSVLAAVGEEYFQSALNIGISYLQIASELNNFVRTYNFEFPGQSFYTTIADISNQVWFFLDPGCILQSQSNFLTWLLINTLGPLIAITYVAVVMFVFHVMCSKKRTNQKDVEENLSNLVLFIIFLFYPSTTSKILSSFVCDDFDHVSGKRFLTADPSVLCDATNPEYAGILATASIMAVIYLGMIPAVLAYLLTTKVLFGPWGKGQGRRAYPESLSSLWGPYRDDCFYMELVEMLRKVLLTSVVLFVGSGKLPQMLLFNMGITFAFTWVYSYLRPLNEKWLQRLFLVCQAGYFWTCFFYLEIALQIGQGEKMYVMILDTNNQEAQDFVNQKGEAILAAQVIPAVCALLVVLRRWATLSFNASVFSDMYDALRRTCTKKSCASWCSRETWSGCFRRPSANSSVTHTIFVYLLQFFLLPFFVAFFLLYLGMDAFKWCVLVPVGRLVNGLKRCLGVTEDFIDINEDEEYKAELLAIAEDGDEALKVWIEDKLETVVPKAGGSVDGDRSALDLTEQVKAILDMIEHAYSGPKQGVGEPTVEEFLNALEGHVFDLAATTSYAKIIRDLMNRQTEAAQSDVGTKCHATLEAIRMKNGNTIKGSDLDSTLASLMAVLTIARAACGPIQVDPPAVVSTSSIVDSATATTVPAEDDVQTKVLKAAMVATATYSVAPSASTSSGCVKDTSCYDCCSIQKVSCCSKAATGCCAQYTYCFCCPASSLETPTSTSEVTIEQRQKDFAKYGNGLKTLIKKEIEHQRSLAILNDFIVKTTWASAYLPVVERQERVESTAKALQRMLNRLEELVQLNITLALHKDCIDSGVCTCGEAEVPISSIQPQSSPA